MLAPEEALDRPADRPGTAPPASPADSPGASPPRLAELAAAIDAMVGLLRRQIERAEARAETAETRIAGLEEDLRAKDAELVDAGKRTDAALALADRLGIQLADASIRTKGEMSTLREVLDGAHATLARREDRTAKAEERAVRAEKRVADLEATAKAQGERAELAEAQIANLEADLAAKENAISQTEADLEVARYGAEAAQQAAAELRLADEGRKGRGRWARLRAAWRGE